MDNKVGFDFSYHNISFKEDIFDFIDSIEGYDGYEVFVRYKCEFSECVFEKIDTLGLDFHSNYTYEVSLYKVKTDELLKILIQKTKNINQKNIYNLEELLKLNQFNGSIQEVESVLSFIGLKSNCFECLLNEINHDKEFNRIQLNDYYEISDETIELGFKLRDGEHKIYYESKELKRLFYVKDGLINGESKFYYKNGIIEEFAIYKNNLKQGKSYSNYENGIKEMETFYIDDLPEGETILYHNNGKISSKSIYLKGVLNGIYEVYDSNNKLLVSSTYKEDVLDGKTIMYNYEDRLNRKCVGTYKNGIKDGEFKYYDDSDNLIRVEIFDNGELSR